MTSARSPKHARNARVNASGEASGTGSGELLKRCGACLKPLPPGAGQKYCAAHCRLLGYAVRELAKAVHGGMAEGLKPGICELAKACGMELRVTVIKTIDDRRPND